MVSIHVVFLSASNVTGARVSSRRVGAVVDRSHSKYVTSGFFSSPETAFDCGSVVHKEHGCHAGLITLFDLTLTQSHITRVRIGGD